MSDPMKPGPITEGLALDMTRALEVKAMPEILAKILGLKPNATPYEIIEAAREQGAALEDATTEIVAVADAVEVMTSVPQGDDELAGNYIRRAVNHVVGPLHKKIEGYATLDLVAQHLGLNSDTATEAEIIEAASTAGIAVGPNPRALALAHAIRAAVRHTAAGLEVGQDLKAIVFSAFNVAKRWAFAAEDGEDTKALKALRLITQDEWQRVNDRATKTEATAGETKNVLLREIARHAGDAATSRAELRLIKDRVEPTPAGAPKVDGKSLLLGGLIGALVGAVAPGAPEAPTKGHNGARR